MKAVIRKRSLVLLLVILGGSWGCLNANAFAGEAKWIRDVSLRADGEAVAFRYGGDLFAVSTDGGEARALVRHVARERRPLYSPDGEQLVFASDRFGSFDLFVMEAGGGEARRLTYHSAGDIPSSWSADGKRVYFRSSRLDAVENAQFPSGVMPELYAVEVASGEVEQVLTTPAARAREDATGRYLLYEDIKGYENPWRKHHRSSIARDIWLWDRSSGEHEKLTEFRGEDRDPHFGPEAGQYYFLSERGGSFNVYRGWLDGSREAEAVTKHRDHPVRFLSVTPAGDMAYAQGGRLYYRASGEREARALAITVPAGFLRNAEQRETLSGEISEFVLSPEGKEVAMVVRGDVYVGSVEHGVTRRITDTVGEERDVSWHPDGRGLLYAGDREGRWRLWEASPVEESGYLYDALEIREREVVQAKGDASQPQYSPDGEKIVYMSGLTDLRLVDREEEAEGSLLEDMGLWRYTADSNHFRWSPDSRWLLVDFAYTWGEGEVVLLDTESRGGGGIRNVTESGFSDSGGTWVLGGKAMLWQSDRDGRRDFRGRDPERSVYVQFFDEAAHERFLLSEGRLAAVKAREEGEETEAEDGEDSGEAEEEVEEVSEPLALELEGLEYRRVRLSKEAADIALPVLSADGEVLYYFAESEDGYALWKREIRKGQTRQLGPTGLRFSWENRSPAPGSQRMVLSPEGTELYLLNRGSIQKIDTDSGKAESLELSVEAEWNERLERAYELEHVYRTMVERFYREDLHGVDLELYRDYYASLLGHIHDAGDFAELLSEFLGELNVSHTGASYRPEGGDGERTASLGFYPAAEADGAAGVEVAEVFPESPLARPSVGLEAGSRLLAIDGEAIGHLEELHRLLNGKAGKLVRLRVRSGATGEEREVRAYPVSAGQEAEWAYERWVRTRRAEVERISGGRLGYVHIRGMNDAGYRQVYEEALQLGPEVEGLVVDTRFNGGGFLHDELIRFFNAQRYYRYEVKGRLRGVEPSERWYKPQILLMSESNYSNAYMVPQVFQDLDLGTLVGMPVAGTGTAVWWKRLPYSPVVFGIPQVGIRDLEGDYLENKEIFPDITVDNPPEGVAAGEDAMLETAVVELLRQLDDEEE